ncbi:hypothetical protein AWW68_11445 [Roseivirga spongicola]|uniref:Uncharacterized protein n=1 Tax=Roseivirga spongicola TaxID=333140 RepID=A0A150X3N5_9BACT|nr:hypothetical protein AWW68_11445 [Roseivirga spongicola]
MFESFPVLHEKGSLVTSKLLRPKAGVNRANDVNASGKQGNWGNSGLVVGAQCTGNGYQLISKPPSKPSPEWEGFWPVQYLATYVFTSTGVERPKR